jgi:hypothetical protein
MRVSLIAPPDASGAHLAMLEERCALSLSKGDAAM